MPLFRALREEEVTAGNILIPKVQKPFLEEMRIPFVVGPLAIIGPSEAHAVDYHQRASLGSETLGVSCTRDWSVALRYATKTKVLVRIREEACDSLGIRRFRVLDMVDFALVEHPEDAEEILVYDKDGPLPNEVVAEVFDLREGWRTLPRGRG